MLQHVGRYEPVEVLVDQRQGDAVAAHLAPHRNARECHLGHLDCRDLVPHALQMLGQRASAGPELDDALAVQLDVQTLEQRQAFADAVLRVLAEAEVIELLVRVRGAVQGHSGQCQQRVEFARRMHGLERRVGPPVVSGAETIETERVDRNAQV